jgi:hypothetical protein
VRKPVYIWNPFHEGVFELGNTGPKLVGGVAAMVALVAGILGQVDPLACVGRAAIALVLGVLGYQVWYVLFTCGMPTQRAVEATGPELIEEKTG